MARAGDDLSLSQARRLALDAQGLWGARPAGGVPVMLRRLGAVQLDTISVLARSHELVTYARRGPIGRQKVEQAFWGPKSATFEYWSHAACIVPLEDWPAYAFKRRARLAKGRRWHRLEDQEKSCAEVVARLQAEGPLTANELGGAKKGGTWWDWSETKIAAEWLLDIGQLVCRERRGFQRVYDLAERAIPSTLLDQDPSDEECAAQLVAAAGRALGVGTVADFAAYHGMLQALVRAHCRRPTWCRCGSRAGSRRPSPTRRAGSCRRPGTGRSLLLSPFDSLIWYRDRVERLFGLRHRLEAYTPKDKRRYGYFAMPVLGGSKIVGLVDPGRDGETLVAKQVTLFDVDGPSLACVAQALSEAASWVGCARVALQRVEPQSARTPLRRLLSELDGDGASV